MANYCCDKMGIMVDEKNGGIEIDEDGYYIIYIGIVEGHHIDMLEPIKYCPFCGRIL